MSRWSDSRCQQDCSTEVCTHHATRFNAEEPLERSLTVEGSGARYRMRTRAVSPPPPGAGPRYRSQCWIPSSYALGGNEASTVAPFHDFPMGTDRRIYVHRIQEKKLSDQRIHELAASISRVPILSSVPSSINNLDIISCANRTEDAVATSDQTPTVSVREHALYPGGKCLLKNRCNTLFRSQVYTFDRLRFNEFGDTNEDLITLDRLPRFRFGGNRAEKRGSDKFRELTERLKRGTVPVPPPRTRHHSRTTPPVSPCASQDDSPSEERTTPLRSASFSQVDYCSDDNKYIKKKEQDYDQSPTHSTLPRLKNISRNQNTTKHDAFPSNRPESPKNNVLVQPTADTPQVQITPESPEKTPVRTLGVNNNNQDRRRRRKGIYLSQWPTEYHPTNDNHILSKYEEDPVCTCDDTAKIIQESLSEINKIHEEKLKDLLSFGSSSQDEPLSPEDISITSLEWPSNYDKRQDSHSPDLKDSLKVSRSDSLLRSDSLSEGEPEGIERRTEQLYSVASDISDCESGLSTNADTTSPRVPRRYSKRPLRGPYGQMLEAEMKKPETKRSMASSSDLKFLEEIPSNSPTHQNEKYVHVRGSCNSSIDETTQTPTQLCSPKVNHKRKVSADSLVVEQNNEQKLVPNHQRTTSSPSKLEGFSPLEVSSEFSRRLLRGSSEELILKGANQALEKQSLQQPHDTRTHVLFELHENERSYVESLEVLNQNYYEPLLKPENSTILDPNLVEEIFSQIPFLLEHHTRFLNQLKERIDNWETTEQIIGDVFLEMFSQQDIIDSYSTYVNNWKRSRDIIKSTQQTKPAFSKFLEAAARQNNRKLALDSLLIKPIQKFPKYELLLQRLIKHTPENHPDFQLLIQAQKTIHEQLLKINCMEKEALDMEQLREVESAIEGSLDLVSPDRQYLRTDMVQMTMSGGPKKDRALFLFTDLLLIAGIKRRSGTINKKTNTMTNNPNSQLNSFEGNKYKLIIKMPLEECEMVRTKDDSSKAIQTETDLLNKDLNTLNQIAELSNNLNCMHANLDELLKEMISNIHRQLQEQHGNQEQMAELELTVLTQNGVENICIFFSKPEQKTAFEEALVEAKSKLILSGDRRPTPEMIAAVPIRKTRAGLQFTCAAPTLSEHGRDLWVCNSDGYVGQVCVLSLNDKEPAVTSCNGVCNTKIICIASVPGPGVCPSRFSSSFASNKNREKLQSQKALQYDSSSTSDEDENSTQPEDDKVKPIEHEYNASGAVSLLNEEPDKLSTMWLGTEDGCILIYNANDYIRIKKNKIKLQHGSSVLAITYFQNRVFASLANGTMLIYERDTKGGWNTNNPKSVPLSTSTYPVLKMVIFNQKIYCSSGITVIVFNPQTLEQENSMSILVETNKSLPQQQAMISCILTCGNALWISLQNTAVVRCYHAVSFELLAETNVAPAATKMLSSCDDIIRQHKAACLKVTALVYCKDLLWIGTSAGVLLTMPMPHVPPIASQVKLTLPSLTGVHHGHTGHVRILTAVEMPYVIPTKKTLCSKKSFNKAKVPELPHKTTRFLVISGGDGCEDFRTSNISEVAGREDSTNHLLIWNI